MCARSVHGSVAYGAAPSYESVARRGDNETGGVVTEPNPWWTDARVQRAAVATPMTKSPKKRWTHRSPT